ncbi:MAG: glycosyltransferase family 2 protein [Deltaproteobacteria bacterium]|nr:glycosyltransferase family 2 protein [Deltaproteobacteria bacterium]
MKLSVVIPAHNEEGCIESTVTSLVAALKDEKIEHEVIVVNDNSSDSTGKILSDLGKKVDTLRSVVNVPPHGFGFAVRKGLGHVTGDAVAIYMADASDRPVDLIHYVRTMEEHNCDCVFGSRFLPASRVMDYPWLKLIINRMANLFIQIVFGLKFNDITNAFKLYRTEVIRGLAPLLSHHFNLTVELPLKSIVRGYSYRVIPIHWTNRKTGESKLKIKEMGSRYLFIVLYCLLEKWLSRGDYRKAA